MYRSGRHFLQIPGPTNVPDRVLHAIAQPTIDHRSAEFAALGREVLDGLKRVFKTSGPVVIFPASGSGAWEAALVNTLSPGDTVLAFETGEFARLWPEVARRLGLEVEMVLCDWRARRRSGGRRGEAARGADQRIRAVLVVHNETSTGVTSRLPRSARQSTGRPSRLAARRRGVVAGSIDLRHDDWGIDVTLSGSQKGLMLPPGLSFNAISEKALAASLRRAAAAIVLGLGADAHLQRRTASSPTRRRRTCCSACAKRCGCWPKRAWRACSRATSGSPTAARAAVRGLGARDRLRACRRIQRSRDGGDDAGWPRCGRVRRIAGERFNLSLGAGLGTAQRQDVPHRPPRRLQRADAGGDARAASR